MTTTEQLRRELRRQADETLDWPAPRLRPTRPRVRWHGPALVAVSVVAVLAALVVVPRVVGSTEPAPLDPLASPSASPSPSPSGPDPQGWIPRRCPKGDRLGCDAPFTMQWGGMELTAGASGGSVPTHHGVVRSADLQISLEQPGRYRLLVGAKGSDSTSRLQLRVGDGGWQAVPSGRPSLVVVESTRRFERVVLRETTRPLPREVLLVLQYEDG